MENLYEIIQKLCQERGISIATMCKETGIARSTLGALSTGAIKELSASKLQKIAEFFSVPISIFFHNDETQDEIIKFALFEGSEGITDEMMEEVKQFAKFVKERNKNKQ